MGKGCAGCACTGHHIRMVVGLEWCMGMPPLVHFLNFISLLVYVSPPCASLPCHASFLAARSEFSWARVVLAVRHRPHEDVVGLE